MQRIKFNKLIKSIHENNVDIFKSLLQDNANFSTMVDENGDSLLHHLLYQENIDLYLIAKEKYPDAWGQLKFEVGQKNKQGVSPSDIYKRMQNQQFKNSLSQYGVHQDYINKQFRVYITCLLESHSKNYDLIYLTQLRNLLNIGHCNGYALFFIEKILTSNLNEYKKYFQPIIEWNSKEDSLFKNHLNLLFEEALSKIVEYQRREETNKHFLEGNEPSTWQQIVAHEQAENFIFPQTAVAKILGITDYQEEGRTQVTLSPDVKDVTNNGISEIINYLEVLQSHEINQHKAIYISGGLGHAIVLCYVDDKFILFDSNYQNNIYKEFPCSKIGMQELALEIYMRPYGILNPNKNSQITFISIDNIGAKFGVYYQNQNIYSELQLSERKEFSIDEFIVHDKKIKEILNKNDLQKHYNNISLLLSDISYNKICDLDHEIAWRYIFNKLPIENLTDILREYVEDKTGFISFTSNKDLHLFFILCDEMMKKDFNFNNQVIFKQLLNTNNHKIISIYLSYQAKKEKLNISHELNNLMDNPQQINSWPLNLTVYLILIFMEKFCSVTKIREFNNDPFNKSWRDSLIRNIEIIKKNPAQKNILQNILTEFNDSLKMLRKKKNKITTSLLLNSVFSNPSEEITNQSGNTNSIKKSK